MIPKRIAVITKYNPYQTKRYFAEKFHERFLKREIESRVIDLDTMNSLEEVSLAIARYSPDLLLNFAGEIMDPLKTLLWDHLKISCWSVVNDPVWYHTGLMESDYSIISCVDRLDCDFIRQQGFQRVHFFPHAVPEDLVGYEERPYDVVFMGSYFDPNSIKKTWERFGDSIYSKIIEEACHLCLSQIGVNPAGALILAVKKYELVIEQIKFYQMVYLIDLYTRGVDRIRLIRSVKDHVVHIFGGSNESRSFGWAQEFSLDSQVVIHPGLVFSEAIEILKQAKVCLNSSCKFKCGIHERVLYALACGAVPITTNNLLIPSEFTEGEDLYLYEENTLDKVDSIVTDLIQNPAKRVEIAQSGRDKVMASYTFDQRISQILGYL